MPRKTYVIHFRNGDDPVEIQSDGLHVTGNDEWITFSNGGIESQSGAVPREVVSYITTVTK